MNIAIRADSSNFMGIGHVMRCLTLANALSNDGHNIHFICRAHPGHLGEKILADGHELHLLPASNAIASTKPDSELSPSHKNWLGATWQEDAEFSIAVIRELNIDWLIVDHYALDENWETALRCMSRHILVIDDLADRVHNCDILLDQTINRPEALYSGLVPDDCMLLVGCSYALLRPDFTLLRPESLAKRKIPGMKQLAIVFGGGDQSVHIYDVLSAIQRSNLASNVKIVVLMQEGGRHTKQVIALAEKLPFEITVLPYIENIAQLMLSTDLVIGAAGGASLERCCLGVPTLMFVLAENQRANAKALAELGAALVIEDLRVDLVRKLNSIINNPDTLERLTKAASNLVDGKGVERVMRRINFV